MALDSRNEVIGGLQATSEERSLNSNHDATGFSYAGFWVRVLATIVDVLIIMAMTAPAMLLIYGKSYYFNQSGRIFIGFWDFVFNFVLPMIATIYFWLRFRATPGKMMLGARIVDEKTGDAPNVGQAVVRYLGYLVSMLPLGLGFIWVAFEPRKRSWHDMMAGTVVIYPTAQTKVRFGEEKTSRNSLL